jgi:hypothetical protein
MSHRTREGRDRYGSAFPPFKARRIFFIAESPCWRGGAASESALWSVGVATSMSIAGGATALESAAAAWAGGFGGATIARGSSAGAKPDDAGGSGVLSAERVADALEGAAVATGFGAGLGAGGSAAVAERGFAVGVTGGEAMGWERVRTGTMGRSAIVEAAVKPPSVRPNGNTSVEA